MLHSDMELRHFFVYVQDAAVIASWRNSIHIVPYVRGSFLTEKGSAL